MKTDTETTKNQKTKHRGIFAALLLCCFAIMFLSAAPSLDAATVTGRSEDSTLAGTEKIPADSSGTDTYIQISSIWAQQALTGASTASGSASFDYSSASGIFKTPTGVATFGGSVNNFTNVIQPTVSDGAALGTGSFMWADLFLAAGGVINWNNGALTVTEASGVLTIGGSGTGDLRITTAGTNAASAVTVGGTQTLTAKTLTAPVLNGATSASGNFDLSGSSGTFKTSTGVSTFGGSSNLFTYAPTPATDGSAALGSATVAWDHLYLDTLSTINIDNGNWVATHTAGILTVGTGDLRVTTAGTNAASVVTVGGTQTLAAKTLTTPVLGVATATTINKITLTAPASGATLTLTDGKTFAVTNTLTLSGTDSTIMTFPSASGTVLTSSLSTNAVDAANAFWGVSNGLVFEGATANGFETTFSPVDPTADQTLSIPNTGANGALFISTLTTNNVAAANSIWGASNSLVLEGATADTSEGTLTIADVTADVSYILPDAAAATYSIMLSTLATNAPDIANSVYGVSNALYFEGATADGFETILTPTDATADRTITMPNESGTLMLSSLSTNATDAANSITGASNALIFEGATADAHEIKITPADATADVIYLLPDAAAASYSIMSSTLATNGVDIANSVTGTSGGLKFEGSTADAYEVTLTATDPTADTTVTIPKATGTMALSQASTTTALTADDQAVAPGANTVLQLTSDNATATNRTFTLSATGAITGQIYVIIGPATNQCEIADTGIQVLSAAWSPTTGDTLTLLFDGTNFNELARSNN